MVQPEITGTYTVSSNRRPDLLTNTITPVHNDHASLTPSLTTIANNQKTVVNESQRQRQGSVRKQESTEQQIQQK